MSRKVVNYKAIALYGDLTRNSCKHFRFVARLSLERTNRKANTAKSREY